MFRSYLTLALEEIHSGLLDVTAAADHLEEGPLRVAVRTEDPINFLDWDRNINTRLNHWTIKENVCVIECFVDVFDKLSFGFPAVFPNELLDG